MEILRADPEHEQPVCFHPDIHRLQVPHRLKHERRAYQQRETQRNLERDRHLSRRRWASAHVATSSRGLPRSFWPVKVEKSEVSA
jgi:hypothetical protein